jgi:ketosteroid isomerase-like protein
LTSRRDGSQHCNADYAIIARSDDATSSTGSGRERHDDSVTTQTSTGDEHPNATAYRRAATAFRAHDLATIADLVDPDVVWHVPGEHPLAGDYRGRDETLRFLEQVLALGFVLTEEDVFGNDQHVCALSQMGVRRPGLEVSTWVVSIFRFHGQRQLERWFYPEDMAAWNAILTDESSAPL